MERNRIEHRCQRILFVRFVLIKNILHQKYYNNFGNNKLRKLVENPIIINFLKSYLSQLIASLNFHYIFRICFEKTFSNDVVEN